jgi:hypothetical protein
VIIGHLHPPRTGDLASQSDLAITDTYMKFPRAPLTGGLAFQIGAVLHCIAGQPKRNTLEVIDKGQGTIEMSWNFGVPQTFTGVTKTIIQAQRAPTDQFTFNLTHGDTVSAVTAAALTTFEQPGRSARSSGIELNQYRPAGSVSANAAGHLLAHLHNEHDALTVETDSELTVAANRPEDMKLFSKQDDGLAVQTGSELTVTVNRPKTNVVQITNGGAGDVQVEWNGGMVHSFAGVATIVVNTRNARTDQVTLTDTSA